MAGYHPGDMEAPLCSTPGCGHKLLARKSLQEKKCARCRGVFAPVRRSVSRGVSGREIREERLTFKELSLPPSAA